MLRHGDFNYTRTEHSACANNRPWDECDTHAMVVNGLVNCLYSNPIFYSVPSSFVRIEWSRNVAKIFTMGIKIISKTRKEAQRSRSKWRAMLIICCNCQGLVQSSSFLEVTRRVKNAVLCFPSRRLREAEQGDCNIAGCFTTRPIQKFLAEIKSPVAP
jgi:hypothetical protein